MRTLSGLAVLTALLTAAATLAPAADKAQLRLLKYAELGKLVRDARGKVVVVDFWQDS